MTTCVFRYRFNNESHYFYFNKDADFCWTGQALLEFCMKLRDMRPADVQKIFNNIEWVNGENAVPEHLKEKYKEFTVMDSEGGKTWEKVQQHLYHGCYFFKALLENKINHLIDDNYLANQILIEESMDFIYSIDIDKQNLSILWPERFKKGMLFYPWRALEGDEMQFLAEIDNALAEWEMEKMSCHH